MHFYNTFAVVKFRIVPHILKKIFIIYTTAYLAHSDGGRNGLK